MAQGVRDGLPCDGECQVGLSGVRGAPAGLGQGACDPRLPGTCEHGSDVVPFA